MRACERIRLRVCVCMRLCVCLIETWKLPSLFVQICIFVVASAAAVGVIVAAIITFGSLRLCLEMCLSTYVCLCYFHYYVAKNPKAFECI